MITFTSLLAITGGLANGDIPGKTRKFNRNKDSSKSSLYLGVLKRSVIGRSYAKNAKERLVLENK